MHALSASESENESNITISYQSLDEGCVAEIVVDKTIWKQLKVDYVYCRLRIHSIFKTTAGTTGYTERNIMP